MSLSRRLARNSLWLLISRVGVQVCALIVTYSLAHRLGIERYGEYSFIAAALVIGNAVTTFGSDMYLIREIAAESSSSRLASALLLQLVLSSLFIVLIFMVSPYLPNQTPASRLALRIYGFVLIPLAFFTVFTSALRGWQKMDSYSWLNLAVSVMQVIAIWFFIPRAADIVALVRVLLSLQVVAAVLAGIFCIRYIPDFRAGWRFSIRATHRLFMDCLLIAIIAILGILYQRISFVLLSLLGNVVMVGSFSAAARVVDAARLGHIAVLTALYPAMTPANSDKDSAKTLHLSWLLLLLAAGGWSLILFILANPIVAIFFGAGYQQSVPVLKILAMSLIPYTVNSFLSLKFLAERRERVVLLALLVPLVLLVLMNLWLIPRSGQVGAGWAFLGVETLQACFLLFQWKINPNPPARDLIPKRGVSNEFSDLR